MNRIFARLLGAALFCLLVAPRAEAENVALELVLAVDVSSSVDDGEYRLQMRGIAEAFRHPDVVAVIEAFGSVGIAVTLMQWSGERTYLQVVQWTRIRDGAAAAAFADAVESQQRAIPDGATAIGDAMLFAKALIDFNAFEGVRRVVDISGDGVANQGERPAIARAHLVENDITVNGLAILNENPRLDVYYRTDVIGGPSAFLVTAADFEDFARAIRIKLITEIDGPAVSDRRPPPRSDGIASQATVAATGATPWP